MTLHDFVNQQRLRSLGHVEVGKILARALRQNYGVEAENELDKWRRIAEDIGDGFAQDVCRLARKFLIFTKPEPNKEST